MTWLTDTKIPIGSWAKAFVDWLTSNADWFFNQLAFILSHVIDGLLFILQKPHPLIVILGIGAIAYWLRRSIVVAVFTCLGLLFIVNQGYWKETTETLALVLASTFVSMIVGIPLGIAAARRAWVYSALRPILDLMQTIPTFVYLIPALILFGLGMVPGLIATVIFAIPAPIRLTRLGIISTPSSLVEAAESFGATPMQVLRKVELPFAMPQIMAGLTQTIMLSLSMVVIAALVGADGLGVPVVRALNTVNVAKGFEAGLCIVILAIILDRMFRTAGEGEGV
ncbi:MULTISPECIES: choline ABC transporter permease subunit [Rhizobium]|uniref:Choline ABC transporter permease subunit n=1 Tax=Rhizobium altiplani TaxID=1864509 RepID=A0A109JQI5_9HYPH|nr:MULTISPECIES: choline ABC transporter permease subunit [Rhizobium]KWV53378.1 choline ABC transporter permease subunit [Rhizobium altiplani]MBD9448309.1 choline ABC transporter permease subunit [Rhizobium sp. RHZ01]MBD9453714.1 choline ABC transporter permease subunit [Rhizobium sp. RHZ02]NMN72240.1 glycine betaine/proline transport system permease protein [Rhizobium sp. 57MFTsu3.2]